MNASRKQAILFLCLGNICRSPMAEGIFRHVVQEAGLADRFDIDSAATGSWHIGHPPDPRAIDAAGSHGVDISGQRCRRLEEDDFSTFDWLICMDHSNLDDVTALQPPGTRARVELFLQFALGKDQGVPDPYLDRFAGFEDVCQLIYRASIGLLAKLAP